MAVQYNNGGGSTPTFGNAIKAEPDAYSTTVYAGGYDGTGDNIILLNVMSNDVGAGGKSLYSVDDGTVSLGVSPVIGGDADLLTQDTIYPDATVGELLTASAFSTDTSALGAKIWITSDGQIGYDANSSTILLGLGQGQTATDSFVYAIRSGSGEIYWSTVTMTVTGSNGAPWISGYTSGLVYEQPGKTGSASLDHGTATVGFEESNLPDTHTVTVNSLSVQGNTEPLPAGLLATLNEAVTTSMTDSTGGHDGFVTLDFSAPDAAFDFLAQGEELRLTYNLTVTDNWGASAATPINMITFTVIGSNDAPVLSPDASGTHAFTVASVPTSAPDQFTTTLAFTDPDLFDSHSAASGVPSFVWAGAGAGTLSTDELTALHAALDGALQTQVKTDGPSGAATASFSAPDSTFDFLTAGQSLTISYNVTVADYHGAASSQPVTITVSDSLVGF